jgi:hypothetical protein
LLVNVLKDFTWQSWNKPQLSTDDDVKSSVAL